MATSQMRSHLHIRRAQAPGPIGKQVARDAAMDVAQPIGRDGDGLRIDVEQFVETIRNLRRQAFKDFGVGERSRRAGEFSGGV